MVRAAFRLMGAERMLLISDTMRAAGLDDGAYTLGGLDVRVSGRRAELADGTLAGSVTDLMDCLRCAVSFGVPPADAVTAAAVNPTRALGVDADYGTLDVGKYANFCLLNEDFSLRQVFFRGRAV